MKNTEGIKSSEIHQTSKSQQRKQLTSTFFLIPSLGSYSLTDSEKYKMFEYDYHHWGAIKMSWTS